MSSKRIKLSKDQRAKLAISVKRIKGQIDSILEIVDNDKVTDQTFIQLLAVKGGATRICKDIITFGIIPNLGVYSEKEISHALDIIFKLDS